jgi:hypothetical protein
MLIGENNPDENRRFGIDALIALDLMHCAK